MYRVSNLPALAYLWITNRDKKKVNEIRTYFLYFFLIVEFFRRLTNDITSYYININENNFFKGENSYLILTIYKILLD